MITVLIVSTIVLAVAEKYLTTLMQNILYVVILNIPITIAIANL